jgi:hypothetical protein
MKYLVNINRRALETETIDEVFKKLVKEWMQIEGEFGLNYDEFPATPDPKTKLLASIIFSRHLGKGIRSDAYFQYRREFEDKAYDDDRISIEFNPGKVGYKTFITEICPILINAFDAYQLTIQDEEFIYEDWDEIRRLQINRRHGVYRVGPVAYYDGLLCKRAFQKTPEEIKQCLEGVAEDAILLRDGIYIIGSSEVLEFEEAKALTEKLKSSVIEQKKKSFSLRNLFSGSIS